MSVRHALRSLSILAIAVCATGLLPSAQAANARFSTEAAFVAAAGSTVIESFEALAARNRVLSPVTTPLLLVTPGVAPLGVQTGPNSPENGFGAAATDGTHSLSVYLPNLPQGLLRLDSASPTTVFGLNLIDLGESAGTVSLRTNVGAFAGGITVFSFPPLFANGTVFFIGLTQDVAFSTVFLDVSGVDDAYGIDKVYMAPVPEPATALSLLAGSAVLGLWAKRRRRNPVDLMN